MLKFISVNMILDPYISTERIAEVEDFVDFLRERVKQRKATTTSKESLDFPVDDLGPWPDELSLQREDTVIVKVSVASID